MRRTGERKTHAKNGEEVSDAEAGEIVEQQEEQKKIRNVALTSFFFCPFLF